MTKSLQSMLTMKTELLEMKRQLNWLIHEERERMRNSHKRKGGIR